MDSLFFFYYFFFFLDLEKRQRHRESLKHAARISGTLVFVSTYIRCYATAFEVPYGCVCVDSGEGSGPGKPFGFEAGWFATISENAKFTDPEMARARSQILDYFHAQKEILIEGQVVFQFEKGMLLGTADIALMKQLCLVTGFPYTMDQAYEGDRLDGTLARCAHRFLCGSREVLNVLTHPFSGAASACLKGCTSRCMDLR